MRSRSRSTDPKYADKNPGRGVKKVTSKDKETNLGEPFRKAQLNISFSEFEIPPMQELLLVGRKAPIGPEAVKRMIEAIAPAQYEVIRLSHPVLEAAVIKKSLLKLVPEEKLLSLIIEESEGFAAENTVLKARINATIKIGRVVEL